MWHLLPALTNSSDETTLNNAPPQHLGAMWPHKTVDDMQSSCVNLAVHVEGERNVITQVVCIHERL